MYFQYRLIENKIKLIQDNVRIDSENKTFWDNKEYNKVFTDWRDSDFLYVGDSKLINPIIDGNIIREMNTLEMIDSGLYNLLEGQYIKDGKIETAEKPIDMYVPVWNREINE